MNVSFRRWLWQGIKKFPKKTRKWFKSVDWKGVLAATEIVLGSIIGVICFIIPIGDWVLSSLLEESRLYPNWLMLVSIPLLLLALHGSYLFQTVGDR